MTIKVAVFNRKGGVGKTTLAIILTQIALMKNKSVLTFDQDEQNNFNISVSYIQNELKFKDLFKLKTVLTEEDFKPKIDWIPDWIIVDCPPSFNERTRLALRKADFIVVPVRPDYYGTMTFTQIREEAGDYKHVFQFPLVKVGFGDNLASRLANERITDKGYTIIGDLPLYTTITANISSNRKKWWSVGLQAHARLPFESVYTRLELLHKKLQELRRRNGEWKGDDYDYYDYIK